MLQACAGGLIVVSPESSAFEDKQESTAHAVHMGGGYGMAFTIVFTVL